MHYDDIDEADGYEEDDHGGGCCLFIAFVIVLGLLSWLVSQWG